jgi:hypothetical protein
MKPARRAGEWLILFHAASLRSRRLMFAGSVIEKGA